MGEYFKDTEEMRDLWYIMNKAFGEDEAWLKQFQTTNCVSVYKFTDPELDWWIDTREGKYTFGDGDPAEGPDSYAVRMSLAGDMAHRVWHNRTNFLMGVTRGWIILERQASKLLKIAPVQRRTGEIYERKLREIGREDLILAHLL